MTADRPATDRIRLSECQECGWLCAPQDYHPIMACWIVKQTGRNPLPYLRQVAEDMSRMQYPSDEGSDTARICKRFRHDEHCIDEPHA